VTEPRLAPSVRKSVDSGSALPLAVTPGPYQPPRASRRIRSLRHARTVGNAVAGVWNSSLQLRVAATTAVVTGVVVLIIGLFLVNEISAGVLRTERNAAIAQAQVGLEALSGGMAGVDPNDISGIVTTIGDAETNLAAGGNNGGLYTVAIYTTNTVVAGLVPAQPEVPAALRTLVQRGDLARQYALVPKPNAASQSVAGLVVGAPVSAQAGLFELYYLFPLTAEQNTIAIVQRTVLLAGLSLVFLVALIALIVTRQVVRPVRVAARTAERLASGDLSERISVHGSDDIALLARSFNDMAASLQRQFRRLEALSRLQRRFTSDVSHELRTPLTTIRMAAEVLHSERGAFAPQLARSVELLRAELDRFESLLADLLEISRYDAGAANLEAEVLDLHGVVGNVVEGSRALAQRHHSELLVLAGDDPIPVEMDPRRVERILRNLIENALDHGEGRPIEIRTGANEHAVAVTVRDHGIGLRPGEAGLVFNRFWRGDPSRSRLTGGTGLGLSISLEDARLHGGWLQAWGERGKGAQFRLTLPRAVGRPIELSPLPLDPDEEALMST
jgi:two-component system sensor histidine kinase MtrB